jgi:hypothetical protein
MPSSGNKRGHGTRADAPRSSAGRVAHEPTEEEAEEGSPTGLESKTATIARRINEHGGLRGTKMATEQNADTPRSSGRSAARERAEEAEDLTREETGRGGEGDDDHLSHRGPPLLRLRCLWLVRLRLLGVGGEERGKVCCGGAELQRQQIYCSPGSCSQPGEATEAAFPALRSLTARDVEDRTALMIPCETRVPGTTHGPDAARA